MEQPEQTGTPSRNTKGRAWCFTWNNYEASDISYLTGTLEQGKYIFGEEVGSNGTPHLQGVVKWDNPRSFKAMQKLFQQKAHIEPCKNWNASINYCSKDGKTYTNIKENTNIADQILEKYYTNITWKPWQQEIIELVENNEPDTRSIYWYWEESGNTGKSFLCKYLDIKYDAIICSGKKADVFNQTNMWLQKYKNQKSPRLIICDIPRDDIEYLHYGTLECLKNGHLYSGKYEGGKCIFDHPHVIIFANTPPLEKKISKDRWKITKIDQ